MVGKDKTAELRALEERVAILTNRLEDIEAQGRSHAASLDTTESQTTRIAGDVSLILQGMPKKPTRFRKAITVLRDIMVPLLVAGIAGVVAWSGNKIAESQREASLRLGDKQMDISREQGKQQIQVKLTELFYKDISSTDPTKQKLAISMLMLMDRNLGEKLAKWVVSKGLRPSLSKEVINVATGTLNLSLLRRNEKVRNLINQKKCVEALDILPDDILAIMCEIEQLVRQGKDKKAVALLEPLRANNESSVGYGVFAELSLAYDRQNQPKKALKLLEELSKHYEKMAAKKLGKTSAEIAIRNLEAILTRLKDDNVRKKVDALMLRLKEHLARAIANPDEYALLDQKRYDDALKMAPKNSLVIGRVMRVRSEEGKNQEAVELYERLRKLKNSLDYGTLPWAALAFERLEKTDRALTVLDDVERIVREDIENGWGYYSRSPQIKQVIRTLASLYPKFTDQRVREKLDRVKGELQAEVQKLTGK